MGWVLGQKTTAACELLSFLIEGLDLEVHVRNTTVCIHFRKHWIFTLYKTIFWILKYTKITKAVPLFWKFMSEPHYLQVSGVPPKGGQAVHTSSQHTVSGLEKSTDHGCHSLNQETGLVPLPLGSLE